MPVVTVVVALFNGSRYLDECVSCLSAQTFRDFEVIFVVDSRSDDGSAELLAQMSSVLPSHRIIIQTDDERVSGARNIGIREATGDLIWLLDVDDHPLPNFLEEMVRVQRETGSDIVFCNHYQVMGRAQDVDESDRQYLIKTCSGEEALSQFTKYPVYPWSRIQRASIFESGQAYFFNHRAAEDVEQTIRSLAVADSVSYYNRPLYIYYKAQPNSLSSRSRIREAESMENTARRMLPFVKEYRPECYDRFKVLMLERLMRQMAFVPYKNYSECYETSIAHEIIPTIDDRTMEMRVFSKSRLLYYLILLPFTHGIWDRKKGLWDPEV